MKGDRISRLILVLEIILIVLLHMNKKSGGQHQPLNPPVTSSSVMGNNMLK